MSDIYIERMLLNELRKRVRPGKVLILLGARRVGKTELINRYLEERDDYLLLTGEDQRTVNELDERSVTNLQRIIGDKKLLVIDEAQKIPEIGVKLKLIVDHIKGVAVIATGSSVFDLSNKLGEPLVGRSTTLHLHPLAQMEFAPNEDYLATKAKLEERLIFGGYPELEQYTSWKEKERYLRDVVNAYLLRDLLEYDGIKKSDKIMALLRLIAFQVGKEVNVDELASNLKGISRNTVESYLDLLSKVFVIYKVGGFSRNLRKEVTKMNRWYFHDNGVRNAIISNFNRLDQRMDKGELWENYLMAERMKCLDYNGKYVNRCFWRTYDQQELDLVEEEAAMLRSYEFKFNPKRNVKVPGGWARAYPDATFEVINTDNYLDFITASK
ncbi:MAG: ATP-binding protein [Flavobacteriales bacterium]|nr:ATP-binding protein [Flavobacteriales bacterium]